ncbi:MAG: OmpA family protein [Candidatus Kapabacteria bacterium]|nr:OmpA family protein [Candidatus Kapabacteria bacterium]
MADEERKKSTEQPIIIKKINKGGHGAHGGAWKVAYADFVTAMMAFFIVMWILAASSDVKESVSAYFDTPGIFKYVEGKTAVPIEMGLKPIPGKKLGEEKGDGNGEKPEEFLTLDKAQQDSLIKEITKQAIQDSIQTQKKLEETSEVLKELVKQVSIDNPDLKELINSIQFEFTDEGLKIEFVESKESLFFKSGSSELLPNAKKILLTFAKEIGKLSNSIEIEGHTDSKSYGNKNGYSNWELSADRANATRRALSSSGLWSGQVEGVKGFADQKHLIKENPFDERNRRVTLLVKQLKTKDIMDSKLGR